MLDAVLELFNAGLPPMMFVSDDKDVVAATSTNGLISVPPENDVVLPEIE